MTGSVAVRLDSNAVCQTNTILSGILETITSTTVVRLDSAASLSWNAYQGLTINVGITAGVKQAVTISSYAGNVIGTLAAVVANQYTAVTVSLYNSGTCPYCAASTVSLYVGAQIDIDVDGNPLTGDDIYTGIITAYSAAGLVTCSAGFLRTSQTGASEALSSTSGRIMSTTSTYTIFARVRPVLTAYFLSTITVEIRQIQFQWFALCLCPEILMLA